MKKHTNFIDKSKTFRKKKWWNLYQEYKNKGILYDSYGCTFEDNSNMLYWDFTFLGKKKGNIYRCCICTTSGKLENEVRKMAIHKAWSYLTEEEVRRETTIQYEQIHDDKGRLISCRWVTRKEIKYSKFDDLTLYEYIDKLKEEIKENNPPEIKEYITTFKCNDAIGLQAIINVPCINDEVVTKFINCFISNCEETLINNKVVVDMGWF